MGRIRYIGSKARISDQIIDLIGPPKEGRFVDVFSGTGIVSRAAADRGWEVQATDHLESSVIITHAQLATEADLPFKSLGGYLRALEKLNEAPDIEGFIFREYAPTGLSRSGNMRKYFTPENARRIDGIRLAIEHLNDNRLLTASEYKILLADLLEATNRVANTAGTYGCFLREFSMSSLRTLTLEPRKLRQAYTKFSTACRDAFDVTARPDDTVYLDPPYTKRQYAAYYHLLETIAIGDSPAVEGKTGLRSWHAKSSPFCLRRSALTSLVQLAKNTGAGSVFISYSSEGHIDLKDLTTLLQRTGLARVIELGPIGRYRPNAKARAKETVTEFLIHYLNNPAKRQQKRALGLGALR